MMRDVIRACRMQAQCYLTARHVRDRGARELVRCTAQLADASFPVLRSAPSRPCDARDDGAMRHLRTWCALTTATALIVVATTSVGTTAAQAAPAALLASPVVPVDVVHLFDRPPNPWDAGHRGIDLRAAPGGEVRSPGEGIVIFSGTVVNRPLVSIALDNGLRSAVEPVTGLVDKGMRVAQGEVIGTVAESSAASHCAPEQCVHWGLRRGEEYLNPLDWLVGLGPIVLLPLD